MCVKKLSKGKSVLNTVQGEFQISDSKLNILSYVCKHFKFFFTTQTKNKILGNEKTEQNQFWFFIMI